MTSGLLGVGLAIALPILLTALAIVVLRYSSARATTLGFERPAAAGATSGFGKFIADNATALATAMIIAIVLVVMVIRPLQYLPVHDESASIVSRSLKGTLSVDSHGRHLAAGDTFEAILEVTRVRAGRACRPANLSAVLVAPGADITVVRRLDVSAPECLGKADWLVAPKKAGRLLLAVSATTTDDGAKKAKDIGFAVIGTDIESEAPLSDALLGAFVTLLSALVVAVFTKKP